MCVILFKFSHWMGSSIRSINLVLIRFLLQYIMSFLQDIVKKDVGIRAIIKNSLQDVLVNLGAPKQVIDSLELTYPKHKNFGDYSTNIALLLAKHFKKAPVAIAQDIVEKLKERKVLQELVLDIKVENPGFINFFLHSNNILKIIADSLQNGESFSTHEGDIQELGAQDNNGVSTTSKDSSSSQSITLAKALFTPIAKKKNKKIIVEHTSVNPNKALHIGHLRNAVLGDTISRLLKNIVENVEVQNYIDDTGVQVADTTAALVLYNNSKLDTPGGIQFDDYAWDIYAQFHKDLKRAEEKEEDKTQLEKSDNGKADINENKPEGSAGDKINIAEDKINILELRKQIVHQIEAAKGEYYDLSQKVVYKILDHHLSDLSKLNIKYNLLIHERDIIGFNLWDYAFKKLKQAGRVKFYEDGKYAGCWVFESPNMPPKILVRSDGTKVYTAKDIAYHLWKVGAIDFDFLYKVWQGEIYKDDNLYQTDPNGKEYKDKNGKHKFGFADKVINVIDYRQAYPQQVVKEAIEEVVGKKDMLYHLAYGVVNLSKKTAELLGVDTSDNKKVYTMSGRKGVGIKAKDLYNKVKEAVAKVVKENYKVKHAGSNNDVHNTGGGISVNTEAGIDINAITTAAIRYQLIKYTASRDIVFDIDDAIQFVGKSGPYLQYSFVRALNILKKLYGNNINNKQDVSDVLEHIARDIQDDVSRALEVYELKDHEQELVNILFKHNEYLVDTLQAIDPVLYAEYAYDLASAFNSFYEKSHIISEKDKNAKVVRIFLVLLFVRTKRQVLENLGVGEIYKM